MQKGGCNSLSREQLKCKMMTGLKGWWNWGFVAPSHNVSSRAIPPVAPIFWYLSTKLYQTLVQTDGPHKMSTPTIFAALLSRRPWRSKSPWFAVMEKYKSQWEVTNTYKRFLFTHKCAFNSSLPHCNRWKMMMEIMPPSTFCVMCWRLWLMHQKECLWHNSSRNIHWYISEWDCLLCTRGKSCFLSQTFCGAGGRCLLLFCSPFDCSFTYAKGTHR